MRHECHFLQQSKVGTGKGKIHPRTGHEGPEVQQSYSFTLSLTSALDRGWVVNATPRTLYPRDRPGTQCVGGWMCPRAGLDGCGKSCTHRHSIPEKSSPWGVAIPTDLTWSATVKGLLIIYKQNVFITFTLSRL
jgi:hypothetical protein